MPLYEYNCAGCDAKFERLRSFSEADVPIACPSCQGEDVRRLISLFASFSKGSDGAMTSIGPSICAGCAGGSCSACGA